MTDPTTTTIVSSDPSRSFFGHPARPPVRCSSPRCSNASPTTACARILVLFLVAAITDGTRLRHRRGDRRRDLRPVHRRRLSTGCVPGGWIADRSSVSATRGVWGGIFIVIGNFILVDSGRRSCSICGLMIIVVGVGLLKPNICAIVGALYAEAGARRDAGFSIFYMGINLGAFIGRRWSPAPSAKPGTGAAASSAAAVVHVARRGAVRVHAQRGSATPDMRPRASTRASARAAGPSSGRSVPSSLAVVAWMFFAGSRCRSELA